MGEYFDLIRLFGCDARNIGRRLLLGPSDVIDYGSDEIHEPIIPWPGHDKTTSFFHVDKNYMLSEARLSSILLLHLITTLEKLIYVHSTNPSVDQSRVSAATSGSLLFSIAGSTLLDFLYT